METEIWRVHPEYTGIEVSTLGRVRSLDKMVWNGSGTWLMKGRILKQCNDRGYLHVSVPVDEKWTTKRVHRLVAQTFIPNLDSLAEVNHKDNDRTNNDVSNLEWCSHSYNMKYREKYGKSSAEVSGCPVYAVNIDTLEISKFESQREAGRELGINQANITKVIKGKYKQAKGFWFVNDDGHAMDIVKSKLHDIGKMGLILS